MPVVPTREYCWAKPERARSVQVYAPQRILSVQKDHRLTCRFPPKNPVGAEKPCKTLMRIVK